MAFKEQHVLLTDVTSWRSMGDRISIVLIEGFIHVIRIEIPKIVRRQLQFIGFALYLAEQEDIWPLLSFIVLLSGLEARDCCAN